MSDHPAREPDPPRSSFFGSIWRGTRVTARAPFTTFPADQILENARLIRTLAGRLIASPQPKVFTTEASRIDLADTSFGFEVSSDLMRPGIAAQRRQTARLAYASFGLGWVFVVLWIWRGLNSGLGGPHLLGAIQFLPFCAIFFLVAFKNAQVNWQLRTGQLGSAGDYLRSSELFWPN